MSLILVTSPVAPPTALTVTVNGPADVDLSWTHNAVNSTGYGVYKSVNGGRWETVTEGLASNAAAYADTFAHGEDDTVLYAVRALGSGPSAWLVAGAVVTPNPSGGDEGEPLIEEDFSTYTSTSNFFADPRNIYAGSEDVHTGASIDTSEGYDGRTQCLQYAWPAGGCTDHTRNRKVLTFPSRAELWFRLVAKFASNFDTLFDVGCGEAASYKFFFFTSASGAYLNRFQLINGVFGNRWDAGHATDQNAYLGEGPGGGDPEWDGEWHVHELHLRCSATDGAFRYRRDGVTQINDTGMATNNSGGLNSFNWLVIGANINQGPLNATTLKHGLIQIFDEDPGWTW